MTVEALRALAAVGVQPDAPPRLHLRNLDAEQNVVGCLLYLNDRLDDVAGLLAPESFSEPFHQRLYAATVDLIRSGRRADATTVYERVKGDPSSDEFGGFSYLAELMDRAAPPGLVAHAEIVADLATRRALADAAALAVVEAGDPERSGQEQIASLEAALSEIACVGATDEWLDAGGMVANAIANAKARKGAILYTWGIDDLDEMTGGLQAGESVIVAGRPGMMKTGVAVRIALANAWKGLGTSLFSLEMAADPLSLRMACAVAHDRSAPTYSGAPGPDGNVWYLDAAKGDLPPEKWAKLEAAQGRIARLPLKVDQRAGLTMSRIEAAVRRLHRQWKRAGVPLGPVIIDHLGIVRPEKDRRGSKHNETADISRAIAEMAKRLGVPVVALCQLNRGPEGREDKRPGLADLRNAGEIEEDARAVVFVYRPAYYLKTPLENEGVAEAAEREAKLAKAKGKLLFLVEKNSHGATGQVEAWCDPATSAVGNRMRGAE